MELRNTAMRAKKLFHRTIRRHRKLHWEAFLDDSNNIWKATKYLNQQGSSSYARVPPIEKAGTEGEYAIENNEIGKELLQAFFPTPLSCEQEDTPTAYNQLHSEPIAKHEVKAAVFRASQDKAPGRDNLPARVWRELWPVLGDEITFVRALRRRPLGLMWQCDGSVPLVPKRGGESPRPLRQ